MISCVLWWRHGDVGWCWGVLGVQPTSSLTHQTTRVDTRSPVTGSSTTGWLVGKPVLDDSSRINQLSWGYKLLSINSFETFENYHQAWTNVETNSMTLRNGIWWLGRVEFLPESFMPESFKHLICSRIRVSTVACRMALHDMPNPHLVDQENCLARDMKSQTGDTHRVSRRFPSRSYRLQLLRKYCIIIYIYIYIIETKTSAMAPPTCNESKSAAFMLYMGIGLGEKQSCKTWQKWANAAQNKRTSFPNIRRHEMFFLNDWKHW